MFVFKAAVVGAGTMGADIAQVIADADIPVVLTDIDEPRVAAGLQRARSRWQEYVDGGTLAAPERDRKLALISSTTGYEGFGEVDFVIEAVPERLELKQDVFSALDEVTPGHAILASNTSALSISELGEATTRPDRVVGFHFFYPAAAARVIEVVQGADTAPETIQAATTFAQALRRTAIRCGETPGFVVNRILNAGVSELWRHQHEAGVEVQQLDEAFREQAQAPPGPFYVADLLGLDTVLAVARHLRDCYGERFYVHPQMEDLVAAGHLGAKTGQGFYEHRR